MTFLTYNSICVSYTAAKTYQQLFR